MYGVEFKAELPVTIYYAGIIYINQHDQSILYTISEVVPGKNPLSPEDARLKLIEKLRKEIYPNKMKEVLCVSPGFTVIF